jgi:hypothetical protein
MSAFLATVISAAATRVTMTTAIAMTTASPMLRQ